jgi:predicted O-methyltransferase YrrM
MRRPTWAQEGSISRDDARFLYERVVARAPDRVVEIGTAAGISTAVMCRALHDAHGPDGTYRLLSYDITATYYVDPSRRVGDATREILCPELLAHIDFRNPATAGHVAADHAAGSLDLLFIDANHQHPWPTLDVLATLDSLRAGAEVMLHDINLPLRHPEHPTWGAKFLFDGLQTAKKIGRTLDPPANVGSIVIPANKEGLREQLLSLVSAHEWEAKVPEEAFRAALAGQRSW